MYKLLNKFFLTITSLSILTGCATIVHGTRQKMSIVSHPSNATVWVDLAYAGQTPIVVEMSRKNDHVVRIQLEGYEPYEAIFSKQISGWAFGNILFGGVIGLAIDAITGGLYYLTPEQMQAELRLNTPYASKTDESCIFVVLEPNSSWQKIGNLTVAGQ